MVTVEEDESGKEEGKKKREKKRAGEKKHGEEGKEEYKGRLTVQCLSSVALRSLTQRCERVTSMRCNTTQCDAQIDSSCCIALTQRDAGPTS